MQVTPHGGLANRCTRPLCDLSARQRADMLSRGRARSGLAPARSGCSGLAPGGARRGHQRIEEPPDPRISPVRRTRRPRTSSARYHRRSQIRRSDRRAGPLRPELAGDSSSTRRLGSGVLGDRVRRLEHVGSTSVPGSRPSRLDILLAVADSSDEAGYARTLEVGGLRPADPRTRLVRASDVQGSRHGHQPARVHGVLLRDRVGCSVPRSVARP